MTDPRPICPIPPDARVGDIVVLRNGERKMIELELDKCMNYSVRGHAPGFVHSDGHAWCNDSRWEVIAFEYADGRKPNLPHTGNPKRTQAQRDAAYLRKIVKLWESSCRLSKFSVQRVRQIADRMEGKT
jgi:hypothetical protein